MKLKKRMQTIVFLSIVALLAGVSCAQQTAPKRDTGSFKSGDKMTVAGRVGYLKNMGGYYVKGEDPPSTLFIENQNPKLLDELYKSKKKVTIEGHATAGADYLFIEKIDGKPYQGE